MSAVLSISATAVVRPTGAASRRSAARPAPLAPRAGLSMTRGASVVSLKAATVRSARRVVMVRASDEAEVETKEVAAPAPAPQVTLNRSPCTTVADEGGFFISQVSLGAILAPVGTGLLIFGFLGYFQFIPGGSLSSLLLIYGFPVTLIGFALKYAELKPLDLVTYTDALALRETQTTAILTQLRNDVTRFKYGDEQHLEEALAIVFRYNRPGGLRKNQAPKMVGISEQVINERYALNLMFESPKMEFSEWTDRKDKIQTFFGPGVTAAVNEIEEGKVEVTLISDGTGGGGGRGGGGEDDDMEVLPPLAPGMPPRYVKKGVA